MKKNLLIIALLLSSIYSLADTKQYNNDNRSMSAITINPSFERPIDGGISGGGIVAGAAIGGIIYEYKEHSSNKTPSNREKHEKGKARKEKDSGKEKKEKAGRYVRRIENTKTQQYKPFYLPEEVRVVSPLFKSIFGN